MKRKKFSSENGNSQKAITEHVKEFLADISGKYNSEDKRIFFDFLSFWLESEKITIRKTLEIITDYLERRYHTAYLLKTRAPLESIPEDKSFKGYLSWLQECYAQDVSGLLYFILGETCVERIAKRKGLEKYLNTP